ncbi:hypothetical protein JKP88DRAFT_228066 [Tribonema minus]|uniref:Uncharacterized protein n=1 Tax=Tribonema minus TaxID=303371 RepID=A0A836C8U8_9STRA|nr:hypothetical protein JKP88DRAFT_228066 [Tribonema minus]
MASDTWQQLAFALLRRLRLGLVLCGIIVAVLASKCGTCQQCRCMQHKTCGHVFIRVHYAQPSFQAPLGSLATICFCLGSTC